MKNTSKKVVAGAMAMMFAVPMFAAPIFAASDGDTSQTTVGYDNTGTDPSDPTADYIVEIPSDLKFTTEKTVDMEIKLKKNAANPGASMPTEAINLKVKSASTYKMNLADSSDEIEYGLEFRNPANARTKVGSTDGTDFVAASTFPAGSAEGATITATATMIGTAKKTGVHTDTLSFQYGKSI